MSLANYESEPASALVVIDDKQADSIIRAETDIQVSTAKRYPRSVSQSLKNAMSMATIDEDTAAGCMYALPRGGKTIEGPSIRLAEIMGSTWGNLRSEARVVNQTDTYIEARGLCWDLETNVATAVMVRRRITKKDGSKFDEDMIQVTSQAACAIARRNAIFAVVPRVYIEKIYRECKQVAVGNAATLSSKRTKLLDSFAKMGVHRPQIFAKLGVKDEDDITLEHLATLLGLASAIKNSEVSIESAFAVEEEEAEAAGKNGAKSTAASVKEKIGKAPGAEPVETLADDPAEPQEALVS